MLQLPVATLALQLWVPSLTVTLPVGVPPPGAFATTVNAKLTAWPTAEGLGACAVIVVVVPAKSAGPPYVAVRFLAPGVRDASQQLPPATVPTQLSVPSLTVTLPVAVPLPGAFTTTL